MPKVSVIVPVYNVERYLDQCLDSLLSQTLQDIEVIVVNDGSTDGSAAVIERVCAGDRRVRRLDQTNGGISSARNAGMRGATGEFIAFVDSDDWVAPEMFETLYQEASAARADIALCTYVREYGGRAAEKVIDWPERIEFTAAETRRIMLRRLVGPVDEELGHPETLDSFGTAWGKVYRTSLFQDGGLRFFDVRDIGTEDCLFNVQTFARARRTIFLRKPLYHYRRDNEGSSTSGYRPLLREQWKRLFSVLEGFLQAESLFSELGEAFSNRKALCLFPLGRNAIHRGNTAGFPGKYRELRSLLEDDSLSTAVRGLRLSHFPVHWRAFYWFAARRMTLPVYAMLKAADWAIRHHFQ